ncbi:MAG: RnfABCDGE type electron transport complex subunit G [Desulfobacterales bacterium]|jgi:electron transport complex protein RnfG|nr:RnfABCDGE type electron transport complex subunit G [Desulfobacterales bacterium]
MKDMIKMVVVLTVLSSFSGGLLAALRDGTKDLIEKQELNLVKGPAIRKILEGASNDPLVDRVKIPDGETEISVFVGVFDGKPNTVVFETFGTGFADKVGLMVGINVDEDKFHGVGVTTHSETPGLGANAKEDPSFAAQFKGHAVSGSIKVTKDGGDINALSGATITSRGVCVAASDAVTVYQRIKPQLIEKLKEIKK